MSALGPNVPSDQGSAPKRLPVVDDEVLVAMMTAGITVTGHYFEIQITVLRRLPSVLVFPEFGL
jgi:hypothetical protein